MEEEYLGWDIQCFIKRKGGGEECEKHYNLGKVSAYCEISYPRNNVESSSIPSVKHAVIFLMDVAWISEVNN